MNLTQENSLDTKIEVALEQLTRVREDIKSLENKIDNNYVTKTEFEPVQKLVYGLVGLVLTTVFGALVLLVIKQ